MGIGSAIGGLAKGFMGSMDDGLEVKKKPLQPSGGFMGSFTAGLENGIEARKKATTETTGAVTGNTATQVSNQTVSPEDTNYGSTFGMTDMDVLDAVAKNEGTYDTGYNTEYAYGKYGGGRNTKFRDMTIAEVLEHQKGMVSRQQHSKLPSSAAGRYQMLQGTLSEEARLAKIDINKEKFTPEMQNTLMMNRLKRMRGYDKWKSGELSDKDFKRNMSKEFASVVNPYTGKGWYKGQNAKPLDIVGGRANGVVKAMVDNAAPTIAMNEDDDDFTTSSLNWSDDKTARWWETQEGKA